MASPTSIEMSQANGCNNVAKYVNTHLLSGAAIKHANL